MYSHFDFNHRFNEKSFLIWFLPTKKTPIHSSFVNSKLSWLRNASETSYLRKKKLYWWIFFSSYLSPKKHSPRFGIVCKIFTLLFFFIEFVLYYCLFLLLLCIEKIQRWHWFVCMQIFKLYLENSSTEAKREKITIGFFSVIHQ